MCGIFGHISNKHYHEEKSARINSYLNDGIAILKNRGPDYSDVKRFQNHKYKFQLGHIRLKIKEFLRSSSSLEQTLNLKRIENDKLLLDQVLMANWLINSYKRL